MGSGKVGQPPQSPRRQSVSSTPEPGKVEQKKSDPTSDQTSAAPAPSPEPKLTESQRNVRRGTSKLGGLALKESIGMRLPESGETTPRGPKPRLERQEKKMDLRESIRDAKTPGPVPSSPDLRGSAQVQLQKREGHIDVFTALPKDDPMRVTKEVHDQVSSELKELHAKYPHFNEETGKRNVSNSSDKEKINLYEAFTKVYATPEGKEAIQKGVKECQGEPAYRAMGAKNFCTYLALSNSNLEKSKAPTHRMTTMERVALLGYTTGDYRKMNSEMRANKGQIQDADWKAYAGDVTKALEKLPSVQQGKVPGQLFRAIYPPDDPNRNNDWCFKAFQKGKTYSDFAFASTGLTKPPQGQFNLEITGATKAKDITQYSAWPGEAEALAYPGTEYRVKDFIPLGDPKKPLGGKVILEEI